ncbi:unnamed protein product [Wuchereria bancrofti]|uniref:Uncharacterized protein n=1 Tax=Wuchereria bancrofti TaxID=6293 RepID=A0A3P7FJY4_WUCBA|nr:unnamed protein product [Wuchereria bancrofti]
MQTLYLYFEPLPYSGLILHLSILATFIVPFCYGSVFVVRPFRGVLIVGVKRWRRLRNDLNSRLDDERSEDAEAMVVSLLRKTEGELNIY